MINRLVDQRYEVVEKVGESSLFSVYKARERTTNRVVALKSVLPPYATDATFLQALREGVVASTNLNHPNITHFYEQGEDEGVPFLIVEYVRGINLKERIRRIAPFTLSVATEFACAITEALHYAHSVGQVHGDLRPQNIIISPEGAVKVTDFGVQRAIARSPQAQAETLLRAAPYHAPELSTTSPGTVSGDLYALGAILYEMLTGTPLYAGDTPEAIADQHAFSAIPSPRVVNPGVPRSLEGIILKCLQKRPDQRYRAAAELLNDLKAVRDALRFGKPLSWSPIDNEKAQAAPVAPTPPASAVPAPSAPAPAERVAPVLEPVADVAASSQSIAMPANANRLRADSERVSIYLRVAIATVTVIILATLIGFVGLWSSMWVVPKALPVPQMVGKPIEAVRQMAQTMKVHLIEHPEYSDRPRGIVYKTDPNVGGQTRQNLVINVWYSKGPTYVDVPNVVGLEKEEAQQKLKDAGLSVGKIMPDYSQTVASNHVISQDVSFKKRVLHDTPVGLIVSDGPKPDFASPDTTPSSPGNEASTDSSNETANPDANASGNNDTPNVTNETTPPPPTDEPHTFKRTISIPSDKLGQRQVKIAYVDSLGTPQTIIDESHNEGDKIPVEFLYYGKNITLIISYNDREVFRKTFDPQTQKERIR